MSAPTTDDSLDAFDSLAPCPPGRWTHGGVCVERVSPGVLLDSEFQAATPDGSEVNLGILRTDAGITVWHSMTADDLSENLVADVTARIADAGLGRAEFESVMVGLVLSTVDDPIEAWATYYRNSLDDLLFGASEFAPVHAKAEELVAGTVLDLGSCFGFFPLRLVSHGVTVTATDIHDGTVRMLDTVAPHLGLALPTLVCGADDVPLPDRSVDTVTALHLLEHVDDPLGDRIVDEALRLARSRVIVAVPFEDEPEACHGHVRTFDLEALRAVGTRTGRPFEVFEHHGGWLVLDAR